MTKDQKKERLGRLADQVRSRAKKDSLNAFLIIESNSPTGASICGHYSQDFVEMALASIIHSHPEACVRVFSAFSTLASQQSAQEQTPPTPDSAEGG